MATSSCLHATQVEEIKRIVGEAMYENEVVGPNGSPVSGGGTQRSNTAVIISNSWGQYNYQAVVPTSITDNNDGTATIAGTSLKIYAGDTISIGGMSTPRLNQIGATVLTATIAGGLVTSATYSTTGLYAANAQQGGPYIYRAWRTSENGWWHIGAALADVNVRLLANYSSGGNDSEQLQAFLQNMVALAPKAAFFEIATNDVYARQWPASRIIASHKIHIDTAIAAGITTVYALCPPRLDGAQNATFAAVIASVNNWAQYYVPSVGGYVVDTGSAAVAGVTMSDQTSAVAAASANVLSDGVHPGRRMAFAYGKALKPIMQSLYPRLRIPAPWERAENGKFWGNTRLTGITGTKSPGSGVINGNVPDGMSIINNSGSHTIDLSIVACTEAVDGTAVGSKLRAVITNATSASNIVFRWAGTPANWSHADAMGAFVRVSVSSSGTPGSGAPASMMMPQLHLGCSTSTTGIDDAYANAMISGNNSSIGVDEAYTITLTTPHVALKSGGVGIHGALAYLRHEVEVLFRGSGSATVDIYHPMIYVPS